jgi:hypothetical protein
LAREKTRGRGIMTIEEAHQIARFVTRWLCGELLVKAKVQPDPLEFLKQCGDELRAIVSEDADLNILAEKLAAFSKRHELKSIATRAVLNKLN